MHRSRPALLLLLLFVFGCSAGNAERDRQVLLLSDVHFAPLSVDKPCSDASSRGHYTTLMAKPADKWTADDVTWQKTLGTYGRDSDYALLHSALQAAHATLPHPALVVVPGDFTVHHLEHVFQVCNANTAGLKPDTPEYVEAFRGLTAKTMSFVLLEIERTWPRVQVIPPLGNNDSDTGDYLTPSPEMLMEIEPVWQYAADAELAADFSTTFEKGGYFSVPLRGFDHGIAIVLNSNLWTGRALAGRDTLANRAAADEFAWLIAQLASARAHKKNVLLVGHVPPGLDAFASKMSRSIETMYAQCNAGAIGCKNYADDIPRILMEYSGTVRLAIFGHTHMNDFRLAGGVPLFIIPSISPLVMNNPAFVIMTTDAQLRPLDSVTWNLSLADKQPQWKSEFDFRAAYGLPDMSPQSLAALDKKLMDDTALRHLYFDHFVSEGSGAAVADRWQEPYLCAITYLTDRGVAPCLLGALGVPF